MEWRQQTSVSCADAFNEAQRWIEEVTGKSFGCNNFRASLENGVLLCDLINQLKPGIIKRVNRLSTPIAGLDNVNVFLKACGKLGLNESQLFHPGDLQDLSTRVTLRKDESNRRLKNVLITIYWLGRKAQLDSYSGPQLNFKAFEGLLGLALSKVLDEGNNVFVKDSWYSEREECQHMGQSCKRENSVDGVDSLDSRALRPHSEGFESDAEAEQVFKLETALSSAQQSKGYTPRPLLRRKKQREENGKGCPSPLARTNQNQGKPEKPVQVNPGWIWSKSLSDIPMVYPVRKVPNENTINDVGQDANMAREGSQENKRKSSVSAEEGEAQWHADLTKWKNRRRSTKSDLRRKSEDREHVVNQMTNGAVTTFEKNEDGLCRKDQQSSHRCNPAPLSSSNIPPSKPSSSDLQPHTRALLARSYATDAPFTPTAPIGPHHSADTQESLVGAMPTVDRNLLEDGSHFASLATDGAGVITPSLDFPFSSQTQVKAQSVQASYQPRSELTKPENITNQISTLVTTIQTKGTTKTISTRDSPASMSHKEVPKGFTFLPDSASHSGVKVQEALSHQKSQEDRQNATQEPTVEQGRSQQGRGVYKYLSRTGSWSSSASLPRGYRRSEGSARLSSAITARPFGTKQSRVSSLPKLSSVENQGLLLNSEKEGSLSSPNQTSFQSNSSHYDIVNQTQLQPYSNPSSNCNNSTLPSKKMDHSDMRLSLTLKPNSRPDFGFQSQWDSTGVRIKLIEPDSPAELCQLCVDDEIMAVDGVAVMHMSYSQWMDKITHALQTGNLTMDIRRYGNKDWSTTEGSHHKQAGQSRMTLNLTAAAPILTGYPDHHAISAAPADTTVTKLSKINGQTDVLQGKDMDGELGDIHKTARHKDDNKIVRTNQKKRADFFKHKGGSESAISDLKVPSLSPPSSSWLWDHEEDRRRQEKWQEEQERLLQEQYQRDQERLEAEWQKAQEDAVGECRESGNTTEMSNGEKPASVQFHVNGLANKIEAEWSSDRDELEEARSKPQSNARSSQSDENWSKSMSALSGPNKHIRGERRSKSKAEKERQQILEEMKKRTQLLTDNSWIRQRSNRAPLKRCDSLDNLDTLQQSPVSATTFSYPRPHSAAAGYCAPSRKSSSRYSTGTILSQRNTSTDSSHPASVWAATDISKELRLESRFKSETRSPTVSTAISNSSALVPPSCDQDTILHIAE
ncbi:LIM domain only protein 7-like isoform X2 [Mastacembelus armatus]|uniref:LIM domain 7b n=1 Tax=Mastacembelus armatus TaxID=205130 RepID=A0A3Q3KS32_9TELE|nr:LIM domain only protein 7-like isoform X2 [Mastacembelus armatus]